jgi:Flp pilus assembly protein TadG
MNRILQKIKRTVSRVSGRGEDGQALIEFTLVTVLLIVLIFGAIDFSRAIYMRQVLINLSRETANLEARGVGSTTAEIMTNALNAAIQEASPLTLNSTNGMVIVTAVTNYTNVVKKQSTATYTISHQFWLGTLGTFQSAVGTYTGSNKFNQGILPNTGILPANRTVYVAEIFYKFSPITPVGQLIKVILPAQFYDVAYFSAL